MRALRLLAVVAALGLLPLSAAPTGKSKERWAGCQLQVTNKTPYRVLIHVDGVYWGWVAPQRAFTFKGIPEGTIRAYGTTQYGEFFWGPLSMKCQGTTTWDLRF